MKGGKSSGNLYKRIIKGLPSLQFKFGTALPAKTTDTNTEKSKSAADWMKYVTLLIVIALFALMKVFQLDTRLQTWLEEYDRSFREAPREAVQVGTVCDLLFHLDEQESILLQEPEDIAALQMDTLSPAAWSTDSFDVLVQRARDVIDEVAQIDINELVYFEALTQNRARLLFADGSSEVFDLGAVIQWVRDRDKCKFFQAVSFEGEAYEYFNILYTEAFEKVNCETGTYYRARLNISDSTDPSVRILLNCGTDLFSTYIYQKTRRRLEGLNPNADFSYRRELQWEDCVCSEESPDSVAIW